MICVKKFASGTVLHHVPKDIFHLIMTAIWATRDDVSWSDIEWEERAEEQEEAEKTSECNYNRNNITARNDVFHSSGGGSDDQRMLWGEFIKK